MNLFEGVNLWESVGGNKLIPLIIAIGIWTVVCMVIKGLVSEKRWANSFIRIIVTVGVLVIFYYWVIIFLG